MLGLVLMTMREYDYPGHSETLDLALEVLCLAVSFGGLAIRALTIAHAPRGTSGRNTEKQEAATLNTTGLYSVTRNPLYLGNFFIYLGIVLFVHLWWLTLIYMLAFWLYYERIIFAEEAFLEQKFGREFTVWAERTPAFFPRLSAFRRSPLPFSLRTVLRREYNGFFAIIAVMFVLENVGDVVAEGSLDPEPWWVAFFGAGLAVWVILRSLKKHTSMLETQDR